MSGAVVGGVGALVGFAGLLAYLLYVNSRLSRALAELSSAAQEAPPPAVMVTELEGADVSG